MPKGSYCKSGCKKHASFEFAAIKRGAEEDFSLNHFFLLVLKVTELSLCPERTKQLYVSGSGRVLKGSRIFSKIHRIICDI